MHPAAGDREPPYLTAPGQWNGTRLTDRNVATFTARVQPPGGRSPRSATTTSEASPRRAWSSPRVSARPSGWANGGTSNVSVATGPASGDHLLRFTYGSRAGGAGQIGLRMDDETLKASVVDVEELEAEDRSDGKRLAYDMALDVLPIVMDPTEVSPAIGELADQMCGRIEARFRRVRHRRASPQTSVIPTLIDDDYLVTADKTAKQQNRRWVQEIPWSGRCLATSSLPTGTRASLLKGCDAPVTGTPLGHMPSGVAVKPKPSEPCPSGISGTPARGTISLGCRISSIGGAMSQWERRELLIQARHFCPYLCIETRTMTFLPVSGP